MSPIAATHLPVTVARICLRQLGDHRLGRDQQTRDGGCILQRAAYDLGGVDDTLGDEIAVGMRLRVVAVVVLGALEDLADDDRAVLAGIGEDLAGRRLQRLAHDGDPGFLILVI